MLPERGSNVKDAPVTRHIDALGCIHIPEDIRKSLGLRTNDELEFCAAEGGILIKKCDEVKNIEDFRDSVAKAAILIDYACQWCIKTEQSQNVIGKLCEVELSLADVLSLTDPIFE